MASLATHPHVGGHQPVEIQRQVFRRRVQDYPDHRERNSRFGADGSERLRFHFHRRRSGGLPHFLLFGGGCRHAIGAMKSDPPGAGVRECRFQQGIVIGGEDHRARRQRRVQTAREAATQDAIRPLSLPGTSAATVRHSVSPFP